MLTYAAGSNDPNLEFGFSGPMRLGKQILNAIADRAAVMADRSRFATLPARYLDDAGVTAGERAEALGYDEPMIDGWRIVASHL